MEKEYDFKFTPTEAQILVDGLSELPVKKALGVLQKLNAQFNEQNTVPEEKEEVLTE